MEASNLVPFWFWAAVVFLYGIVIGSFLNVCIYRMPNDMPVSKPPSHCPNCNKRLRALDLVPLFSFLLLGRKCRYCGVKISWRYFGVELLTGLVFVAIFAKYHFAPDFFAFALFGAALIAVVFIDLEHWIIPDQLSVFGILLGIGRDIYGLVTHEHSLMHIPIPFTGFELPMLHSIAGLLLCGGIFWAIAVLGELAFKKEAMGGGDIKLAAAIGALFPIPLALLSFFIAVFAGSIIGIGMKLIVRNPEKDNYLPFGPMMVLGVFVVMFYGQVILDAYLRYFMRGGL